MNVLALDYGTKKIGIAIGNTKDKIAFPYTVCPITPDILFSIRKICEEKNIKKILIGKPVQWNKQKGNQWKTTKVFFESLEKFLHEHTLNIELEWFDERFSTYEAKRKSMKLHSGKVIKKMQKDIDAYAAACFLETFFSQFE